MLAIVSGDHDCVTGKATGLEAMCCGPSENDRVSVGFRSIDKKKKISLRLSMNVGVTLRPCRVRLEVLVLVVRSKLYLSDRLTRIKDRPSSRT